MLLFLHLGFQIFLIFFFTLSIHFCFGRPSDLFPRVSILIPLSLDYLTSIHRQYMRFFYNVILITMSGSLYNCCDSILLFISYCRVILFLFGSYILLNILQNLLFYLHLLWLLTIFNTHTNN
jgi:hypothetical protein